MSLSILLSIYQLEVKRSTLEIVMISKLIFAVGLASCALSAHAESNRPSGYKTICKQGKTCSVSDSTKVAFGSHGKFVYKVMDGSFKCDVATFGSDPISKKKKECSVSKDGKKSNDSEKTESTKDSKSKSKKSTDEKCASCNGVKVCLTVTSGDSIKLNWSAKGEISNVQLYRDDDAIDAGRERIFKPDGAVKYTDSSAFDGANYYWLKFNVDGEFFNVGPVAASSGGSKSDKSDQEETDDSNDNKPDKPKKDNSKPGKSTGNPGYISIKDKAPGWASQNGGTTGGGTDLGKAVTVSSMAKLQSAVKGSSKKIVLVKPGKYKGELKPGSNTTIIGTAPGVVLTGNISISGSDISNVIVRNIAVRGNKCGSYNDCKNGKDAVYIGHGATNIWFDHVDVADGQDGNFDITQGADYVTVSWSHFHYTYKKEHRFSNLIAGSDSETKSKGKLRITYMNSWWGKLVDQRQPRGRFGKIHLLNNLHNSQVKGTQIVHGLGKDIAVIIENCFYDIPSSVNAVKASYKSASDTEGWKATGNAGSAKDMNSSHGSVFKIPYSYSAMKASEVEAAVTSTKCGAGNSCELR